MPRSFLDHFQYNYVADETPWVLISIDTRAEQAGIRSMTTETNHRVTDLQIRMADVALSSTSRDGDVQLVS